MVDQRLLPAEETYPVFKTYEEVAWAIKEMVVRGAPAIGVAAAMGVALGVRDSKTEDAGELDGEFERICDVIGSTRPTAVNLFLGDRSHARPVLRAQKREDSSR